MIQFILSIYGGYFGGAIGLMMMAVWTLIDSVRAEVDGRRLAHCWSAPPTATAVLCFALAGAVRWPEMLAMMVSAIAGGYYGARFARHLPPPVLRWFVVALSATVTFAFFSAAVLARLRGLAHETRVSADGGDTRKPVLGTRSKIGCLCRDAHGARTGSTETNASLRPQNLAVACA